MRIVAASLVTNARVSTRVDSEQVNGAWEGTIAYSRVATFSFSDVLIALKVERYLPDEDESK